MKIGQIRPDYEKVIKKLNLQWKIMTEHSQKDIKKLTETESVRSFHLEKHFVRMYRVFSDTFQKIPLLFPQNSPELKEMPDEPDILQINKKNEFCKRVIAGFPLSWLSRNMEELTYEEEVLGMQNEQVSSPFYDT